MEKILVVEDNGPIGKSLTRKLELNGFDYIWAKSKKEALEKIETHGDFFASVLDLSLPDAPDGEVVDEVLDKGIPVIVFTALSDDNTMDEMNEKNIIDYIVKNGEEDIDYAVKILNNLRKNRDVKALVVDDSRVFRRTMVRYLKNLMFDVREAQDGAEALEILRNQPEIKLLLTDYHMPNMDGYNLTLEIRKTRKKDSLVIIACTARDSTFISSKFLKFGANDYVVKPFTKEEFNYRIIQNMEILHIVRKLEEQKKELYLLNNNLEKIVRKEVEKNREKQRMLEIQTRQAQMGEMIAAIAHQWRQPLNILSITIQKLHLVYYNGQLTDEYMSDAIEKSMEQIKYMSQTIDDFRNFFQPDKEKSDFDLVRSVKKVMRLLEPSLKENRIESALHAEKETIMLHSYENEISQVLISIINNAKDELVASEQALRRIDVDISIEGQNVKIVVKDNGRGIKEDLIERIFDPYFSTKENLNGTGLGLYMSKMIVEKNLGGRITARNENGAVFEITLPMR